MRRLFKRMAAITSAAAMVLTLAPVSSAATNETSGTIAGDAVLEGYLNKDVFNMVLPTMSTKGLSFTADPQGLLHTASAEKWTEGKGAVYFDNTTYTKDDTFDNTEVYYVKKADGTFEKLENVTGKASMAAVIDANADAEVDLTAYPEFTPATFHTLYTADDGTTNITGDGAGVAAEPQEGTTYYVKKESGEYEKYNPSKSYSDTATYTSGNSTVLTTASLVVYTKEEKYDSTSKEITVANKSSFDVDVALDVKVNTAKSGSASGITLAEKSALATATTPSLYLGLLVDDSDTAIPITSETYSASKTKLDKVPESRPEVLKDESANPPVTACPAVVGYEVKASEEAIKGVTQSPNGFYYQYVLADGFSDDSAKKVSYKFEAACDSVADWSTTTTTNLSLEVTWSAKKHVNKAVTGKSNNALKYDLYSSSTEEDLAAKGGEDLEIATYTGFSESDISKIEVQLGEGAKTELTTSGGTKQAIISGGSIKLDKAYLATLTKSDSDYTFTITYDTDKTVAQKVLVSNTAPIVDAAPSIAVKTGNYSKTSGATIATDLGSGNLAATNISKLEISADNSSYTAYTGSYSFDTGNSQLKLNSGYMTGAGNGQTRYVKVTFDDDAKTAVVITLTVVA